MIDINLPTQKNEHLSASKSKPVFGYAVTIDPGQPVRLWSIQNDEKQTPG
ncbi:MAG: hypothetical protein KKH60_08940 [Proteobacteria bacterium]|nr:hypothetical protein [Pseudomonadota bacterium]